MRFLAILNEEGGTMRTTDLDRFREDMRSVLQGAGHELEVRSIDGAGIEAELKRAATAIDVDVVLVGGGDGTVSCAAGILMGSDKRLAVLPAGTMNLFARSLGIPLDLASALESFADGIVREVDVATANDRPFIHQFSIGLHARMVEMREEMEFGSRLGKIGASLRAAIRTVMNPPSMRVRLLFGDTEVIGRTTGIGVTNNLFGEGHLPYADTPDGGILGIYVTLARQSHELVHFALNMARGKWKTNEQVEIHEAQDVEIQLQSSHRKFRCVIDGELHPLAETTRIRIHPKSLKVLVPNVDAAARAA